MMPCRTFARLQYLLVLLLCLPVGTVAQTTLRLIPMPREVHTGSDLGLPAGLRIVAGANADDAFAANEFGQAMFARGISTSSSATATGSVTVELLRSESSEAQQKLKNSLLTWDPAMQSEGYAIVTNGPTVSVIGASAEGVFYGLQTVKQMIEGSGAKAVLHGATIRDWPAMRYRGVHDDLSRGPVPTLEFQKKQIQTFAAYKINVYSPYFEHTMQYTSNPLAGPPGGTITKEDAAALVAFAKLYHVTIIPEQEAFGHLHHLLTWEQYSALAETPHGDVLSPVQPGSLALATQWFNELAAEYPGPFLHIGADETVELGTGQTQAEVQARGLGTVYLDFLQQIQSALRPLNRKLLFWGDIAMSDPQLVAAMPEQAKKGFIAVAWSYNPEPTKGFNRFLTPFTNAGMETWVSPGVNNWRRVYPNYGMALANIQGFVRDGQALGSTGMLNTVWNDDGDGLFNSDWYGILFGAAAGWQKGESSIPVYQRSYGFVFHGDPTGYIDEAQREMIAAHALLKEQAKTGDASNNLFWLDPWSKAGVTNAALIRPYTREVRLHAERALILIGQARNAAVAAGQPLRETDAIDALELGARRMDLIGMKFQLTDEITAGYARAYAEQSDKSKKADVSRELNEIGGINGRMQDLRDNFSLLHDLYEQAWMRSNRPYFLHNVISLYDMNTQLWIGRASQFRDAIRQWNDLHTLPPAAQVGLPGTGEDAPAPRPAPKAVAAKKKRR